MPEEVADVKTSEATPESSTGTTLTPPSDPAAYSEWRLSGKMPGEKKPKKEAPAASESAEAESSAQSTSEDHAEESETAPEAGKTKQEHRKGSAESRLNQILADLKRAGLSPSELKTFKREAQGASTSQALPVPRVQAQEPAQTSVNPPASPQPPVQAQQRLTEPKLEDYKTWDEFQGAQRAFNAQMVDDRIREAWQQIQQQQAQDQANRQAAERLQQARERYGDEAEGSITLAARSVFGDQAVHPAIKGIINESPVIADLLYVMGSNETELQQFIQTARTNPGEALRRAVVLEQYVKDELHKVSNGTSNGTRADSTAPERDESGRFLPAKKEAPPPAREVSGRASPPPNEADAAFNRGDARGYMNAKNREQIAARKGR
jgi:hypothetical protein